MPHPSIHGGPYEDNLPRHGGESAIVSDSARNDARKLRPPSVPVRIGVDVGGPTVIVAHIAADDTITIQRTGPVGQGNDEIVASIVGAVAHVPNPPGEQLGNLADLAGVGGVVVGVATPGLVADGWITHAPGIGIEEFDLAGALEREWGVRPLVENDVNAAVVGAWMLAGSDATSAAFLDLNTRIEAGLLVNGKLWRGSRGAAGQVDTVAADPDAEEEVDALAHRVATSIRTLVVTVDVETVYVSGEHARVGRPLRNAVTAILKKWASEPAGEVTSLDLPLRVRWLDPEEPVSAVGAATLALEHEQQPEAP